MALNATGLKTRIVNKLEAAGFDTTDPNCQVATMAQAIAEAVIEEIEANGAISVTTTCPAGAGTGTGNMT